MSSIAEADVREMTPWCAGGKLPWADPEFSERMLKEHLSQAHDEGSRRLQIIDTHVEWLHREVLRGKPSRILDLGCGPGLHTERLARLGHSCLGIDFSPASIRYAKEQAAAHALACEYIQEDVVAADYGSSFDLAMFLFGELNAFPAAKTRTIIGKIYDALAPGGIVMLEMFELQFLAELGKAPKAQNTVRSGVFSARPYTRISEHKWFPDAKVTVERHTIIEADTQSRMQYANTLQGYSTDEYRQLLESIGFRGFSKSPCLGNQHGQYASRLCVLMARKPDDAAQPQ
jgi:2-polyprenyl-3-methyl-5-hydroxy-6-metoxy-1,4-benzoquinol methylase